MTRLVMCIACIFLIALYFNACNYLDKNLISTYPAKIAAGEIAFNKYCSGCHNFRQNDIGPQLSGVTGVEPVEWLLNFIKDPQALLQSGDKHAQALHQQYKATMPSFGMLNDSDINNIIAFLNIHNEQKIKDDTTNAVHDPIHLKIPLSSLVVSIKQFIQVTASSDSGKKPLARIPKLDYQSTTKKLFIVDLRCKLYTLEKNK